MVVAWGRGDEGQLGQGDAGDNPTPQEVAALSSAHCTSVHCGAEYSVAVSREDKVFSWGW